METNDITSLIIRRAIEVHRKLGPGLLESAYRECLAYELKNSGLQIETEKPLPLVYKTIQLEHGYRIDILVEDSVVIELKTVDALIDTHKAQILTYLKLGCYKVGLLINFNVKILKNGIRRYVNNF